MCSGLAVFSENDSVIDLWYVYHTEWGSSSEAHGVYPMPHCFFIATIFEQDTLIHDRKWVVTASHNSIRGGPEQTVNKENTSNEENMES